MQRSLIWLFRLLPLWLLYGVMALVIPFYIIFDHSGRNASWRFFRQRMGYGTLKSAVHVYLNMFSLGMVVLDRFAAYAGKSFMAKVDGEDYFQIWSQDRDGFMIHSCHTGNWEMSGYIRQSIKHMNVLVYAGETATVMGGRTKMFESSNVSMVTAKEDLSHLYILNSALSNGEIVSIPSDRAYGSNKVIRCPFLGAEASFPAGPFRLAAAREARTMAAFCMKTGYSTYTVLFRPIHGDSAGDIARAFAGEMETVVRKWPDQWFNFYDFWS